MAKEYLVVTISPGIFSGNLNAQKLQRVLNDQALSDWKFSKSIADTRTYLLIFRRQAHFLIFEREFNADRSRDPVTRFETVAEEGAGALFWVLLVVIAVFVAAMAWKMRNPQ